MNSSIKLTNTLLLILSFTVISFAQNGRLGEYSFEESLGDNTKRNAEVKQKWMKIESDDKEFSIAFPSDSVIDSEKRSKTYRHRIWGKTNGVTMHMTVYSPKYSKTIVSRSRRNGEDFKIDDYIVQLPPSREINSKFSQIVIIRSKKSYYRISIKADEATAPEISKFLHSIQVKGKPIQKVIAADDSNKNITLEKTISFKNLTSSPEVIEAYKRKPAKTKRKVRFDLSSIDTEDGIDEQEYSRDVIILEQSRPKNLVDTNYDIKLKVQLFADGQVGDVVVLDAPSESVAKRCCVKNLKKLKFLPAQINGKNVDSYRIFRYSFRLVRA